MYIKSIFVQGAHAGLTKSYKVLYSFLRLLGLTKSYLFGIFVQEVL